MALEESPWILVAAIDFGTTFSGYAFSFKSSPETIIMNKNWGENIGYASYKTHTSVLTDQRGKFVDFGFDAEDRYAGALEDEDEPEVVYRLFRHFKMILHSTGKLSRATQIEAIDGKTTASALEIFSHALRYLKKHMLDAITKTTAQPPDDDMIRWVVTVPAIWTEESKQFMREAAFKAQLINTKDSRKLVIALEPEAASLCCRRMDIAKYPEGNVSIQPGTKYLVIDAGGGTVDITAHQVQSDGSIKELHTATGGAWGGTRVDANLVDLLRKVLGDKFIDGFQKRCPQQWLVFMTNFEKLKKHVSLKDKCAINIALSYAMDSEYKEIMGGKKIEDAIRAAKSHGVGFQAGNIMIKEDAARTLFKPVVQQIIDHVKDLLSKPELDPCKLFFLVGGFSESKYLQEMIKAEFQPRIKILIPSEAQMAVIKGAVLFGHKPTEIKSRIMRKTYGCKVVRTIDDSTQFDMKKPIVIEGTLYCDNVLAVFVSQDDEIDVGQTIRHNFRTTTSHGTDVCIALYQMDRKPKEIDYVDGPDVHKVGEFYVETPGQGKGRPVHIDLTFGGTEIQIEGQASGKPTKAKIDFMTS